MEQIKKMEKTNSKRLVTTALFAAMTCVATMIIKFPTPTFGYIHIGDCFVLLSGVILGPYTGALAAGVGSMLADMFAGYLSFAPATLIVKALTAFAAGLLFRITKKAFHTKRSRYAAVAIGGFIGETIMVIGYFLYEAGVAAFGGGGFTAAALAAGITASAAGIPFNIVQGVSGILLSIILLPLLAKIPDVREWMG